ncbi:hypothetical protein [Acidimangrovimonas pyrenivorans]|uniref:Translocase n=1 Tax=Acidimangrovimonas pyrenivorans TaxID=2030798 RepID=A0ABV7AD07_9RHOB
MKLIRKVSLVAATFFLAAATGQVMQTMQQGDPAPKPSASTASVIKAPVKAPVAMAPVAKSPAAPAAATKVADAVTADAVTQGAEIKVEPLSAQATAPMPMPVMPKFISSPPPALRAPVAPAPHAADQPVGPLPGGTVTPAPLTASCAPAKASLTVTPGAMLSLTLAAPCHASQRVVIRHGGLAFTAQTDAKGALTVQLPAMTENAEVTVRFAGGDTVAASAEVPELSLYDRVAVQWIGDDAFDLHGLEFGAEYGGPGDISAANPGSAAPATEPAAGFLVSLGDASVELPMLAQVYTYPTRLSARDGAVKIAIEAEVTDKTCGRDMLAETLRTRPNGDPVVKDLSVSMPGCDATGGYVELTGLLPDIQVAGN